MLTYRLPSASGTHSTVVLWRALLFDLDAAGDPMADPQPKIYRAGRDGEAGQALSSGLGPAWSPDGRQIAYAGPPFMGAGLGWG